MRKTIPLFILYTILSITASAQELKAKVTLNTQQIQGRTEDCETMRQKVEDFLNTRHWTEREYAEQERIDCTLAITVNKYSQQDGAYECTMQLTSTRPVWGTAYQTVLYSCKDNNFHFKFDPADQLEYNFDNIDNQLVALLAYYAHLIIGIDMDTFSPLGGTEVLNTAQDIVNKAQNLSYSGWSAFNDNSNRHALLNDYMEPSMESMRTLNYRYHRQGLDLMADSTDTATQNIITSLELLDEARQGRTMSNVPQLFAEYKRQELVNLLTGKGTPQQRQRIYDILFALNPSMAGEWEKIKK